MRFRERILWCVAALLAATMSKALAEPPAQGKPPVPGTSQTRLSDYVLGPGDEITILTINIEEIANKPIRISTSGEISLPMVGKIHVAGMTVNDLEAVVTKRLEKYYKEPDISISVTALKSQPVTVIGVVHSPNTYQLEGRKTLVEVLAMAGGAAPEASSMVTITRLKENGRIPLPSATVDEASGISTGAVNIKAINEGLSPEQNIQILPYDVISVRRAPVVYAVGQFNQQGRFALADKESVSVRQLVAWAGGTTQTAGKKNAKILRPSAGTVTEVTFNLSDVMSGKAKDLVLQGEDILFLPESAGKRILNRGIDGVMQTAVGLPFYLIP